MADLGSIRVTKAIHKRLKQCAEMTGVPMSLIATHVCYVARTSIKFAVGGRALEALPVKPATSDYDEVIKVHGDIVSEVRELGKLLGVHHYHIFEEFATPYLNVLRDNRMLHAASGATLYGKVILQPVAPGNFMATAYRQLTNRSK